MDLLFSLAIIVVLIAITLPVLVGVREIADRVVCQSNLRQIGLATFMYSEDYMDFLPPTAFVKPGQDTGAAHETVTVRLGAAHPFYSHRLDETGWDGLGLLRHLEYTPSAEVFYCPSHPGEHTFDAYARAWNDDSGGTVVANYQFRGVGPDGDPRIFRMTPQVAIAADALRSREEWNHDGGLNVLNADYSVRWVPDDRRSVRRLVPADDDLAADQFTQDAWRNLDNLDR